MAFKQVAVTLHKIVNAHSGSDEGGSLEIAADLKVSKIRLTDDGPLIMETKTFWEVLIDDAFSFPEDVGLLIDKREDFILRPGQGLLFTGNVVEEDGPFDGDDIFDFKTRQLKYEDINESSQEYDFIVKAFERASGGYHDEGGWMEFFYKIQYISGGTI